jgi:hypothetical protein
MAKSKTTPPPKKLLPEVTPDIGAFLAEVDKLGSQAGLGMAALTILADRVIAAAIDGSIEPRNAKDIYDRYAAASKNAGGTPGSIKTNTSKIKKLIELGGQSDGAQIADDAARIRDDVADAKSPFEGLVEVARRRLKAKCKLTDEEIRAALTRAEPRAKSSGWAALARRVDALVAAKDVEQAELAAARAILDQITEFIAQNDDDPARVGGRTITEPCVSMMELRKAAAMRASDFHPDIRVIGDGNFQYGKGWQEYVSDIANQLLEFERATDKTGFVGMNGGLGGTGKPSSGTVNKGRKIHVPMNPMIDTKRGIMYRSWPWDEIEVLPSGFEDHYITSYLFRKLGAIPLKSFFSPIRHPLMHSTSNDKIHDRELWKIFNLKRVQQLWDDPSWSFP